MKNNIIIVILLLFLAVTSFFWFQSLSIRDLPVPQRLAPPAVGPEEAETFIKLAEEILMRETIPLPEIYGRDPFYKEKPVEEVAELDPATVFTLSSIMYGDLNAFVVVNGEILAEGDTLYDEGSGSQYMIESIEAERVEITNGDKKYALEKAHESGMDDKRR